MIYPRLALVSTTLATAALVAACTGAAPTTAPATPLPPTEAAQPTVAPPTAADPAATATPAAEAATPTVEAAAALTGVQTYSFDPTQSEASYSVEEYFLQESNRLGTAVGVSSEISGDLQIDFDDPAASPLGTVTVDISVLKSDSDMRDNAIRRQWLQSATYPLATFTATAIEGLNGAPIDGQEVTFKLTGDMTVHDTTIPVTWDVTAKLDGESLVGTATTRVLMKDFGFDAPSNPFISVTDGVTLTLKFVLLPAS